MWQNRQKLVTSFLMSSQLVSLNERMCPSSKKILRNNKQAFTEFWRKAALHVVLLLKTELSFLLRTPQQRLPLLFNGWTTPRNCPFPWGSRVSTPCNTWFHASQPSKLHLNWLSCFAGLWTWSTDRPKYSICSSRPHLATAAMRPKNEKCN